MTIGNTVVPAAGRHCTSAPAPADEKPGGNVALVRFKAVATTRSTALRDSTRAMTGRDETTAAESGPTSDWLGQVFAAYQRPLLRYLTALLSRREDAEDTVQETYVRLLAAAPAERSTGRLRALIFRIATNLAYDRFRERKRRVAAGDDVLLELVSPDPSPDGIVGFEQAVAIVKRTLLELKPRCRQVFLLRAHFGLSYEDIATRLKISKRTVEREMQHALEVCQRRLGGSRP